MELKKIKKQLIQLQRDKPFYAYLGMYLNILDMSDEVPTVGVSSDWKLVYNKDFVSKLDKDKMRFILCHEILHLALNHIGRIGNRNVTIANIAQDAVVNYICALEGYNIAEDASAQIDYRNNRAIIKISPNDKGIKVEDISEKPWEKVYDEIKGPLQEMAQEIKKGLDEHMHEKGLSEEDAYKSSQLVSDAYSYSKSIGSEPAGIKRYLDRLLEPKVNWKNKLIKFVKSHTDPRDFTYSKPHKKSQNLGVFMPEVYKESQVPISILIDTSGSISKKEYERFLSEIYAIANTVSAADMRLYFGDVKINTEIRLKTASKKEIMNMIPKGCGGTAIDKMLEELEQKNNKGRLTIVFTDGYTEEIKKQHSFEIIWCISESGLTKDQAKKTLGKDGIERVIKISDN